jgi:hypothetical protein
MVIPREKMGVGVTGDETFYLPLFARFVRYRFSCSSANEDLWSLIPALFLVARAHTSFATERCDGAALRRRRIRIAGDAPLAVGGRRGNSARHVIPFDFLALKEKKVEAINSATGESPWTCRLRRIWSILNESLAR